MKKAFDQTVRDLKREVNKKVLKVPSIEQKVLDATSNEPWGPHGSLLADIAQASRNYHEYQMIMTIIWKRINDTGKNWRHVYKALTVLEYMVANGSERVIEEIREHAYQIQTLNSFQYIDSSGKDQGNNVRRKSQSLVVLVGDKERISEVRQKAAANRDKFRSMSSSGGMYRPGSYSDFGGYGGNKYDDYRSEDRDRGRDDYDYGRDREGAYYRDGDSYSRDGDRYGRDNEDRYGRDSYRDGELRGRSRSTDDYHYGRSRSSDQYRDRDRDRNFDDDGHYSSRGGGRADSADDSYRGEGKLDRKFSEQNLGVPPSYEEAVSESRSPNLNEREGGSSAAAAPKPPVSPVSNNAAPQMPPTPPPQAPPTPPAASSSPPTVQEFEPGDEFDPRVPIPDSAAPSTSKTAEEDLFGSLSDSFNPLAIMPVTPYSTSEVEQPSHAGGPTFASQPTGASSQGFDNPFGDSPFRAVPSTDNIPTQPQPAPIHSFPSDTTQVMGQPQVGVPRTETVPDYGFGSSVSGLTYSPSEASTAIPSNPAPGYAPQQSQPSSVPPENPNPNMYGGFAPQTVPAFGQGSASQMNQQVPNQAPNYGVYNTSQFSQTGQVSSQANVSSSAGPLALVPQQQDKDKFETKSTVWADTLSRGLVNLNISGRKTNPLADIGVDFDALNRKEKRMEKTPANPPISTVNMGKAMGSGTGMGRAGATALRPPPNPMVGSNMGMNMGGGMGSGMAMGGYRGTGQPMGMGMNVNVGMGMNAGMMQRPGGAPQGPGMPGAYNPMMGSGGYNQQQYGGGYR